MNENQSKRVNDAVGLAEEILSGECVSYNRAVDSRAKSRCVVISNALLSTTDDFVRVSMALDLVNAYKSAINKTVTENNKADIALRVAVAKQLAYQGKEIARQNITKRAETLAKKSVILSELSGDKAE